MVEEKLIGKYRDTDQNKITFEYLPFDANTTDEFGNRVQFVVSIYNEQNEFKEYYTHTFIFDSRLKWSFDPTNALDRAALLNALRDIVIEGNYNSGLRLNGDAEDNSFAHWRFNNKPMDRYSERLTFHEDEQRISYTRIPDLIVKENTLIRFLIIKNLYSNGGRLIRQDLQEIVDVDEDIFNRNLEFLKDLNLVKCSDAAWVAEEPVRLTAEGELFYERQFKRFNRKVFIIMTEARYQRVRDFFRDELMKAGFEPYFQGVKEPSQEIVPDIYEKLRNCMFVIADLTGLNENSLFELGFAQALGKRIVITRCDEERNGEADRIDLPFYLKQFRQSLWYRNKSWDDPENVKFQVDIKERIRQAKDALTQEQFNLYIP